MHLRPLSSPLHRVPILWSLYRPLLRLAPNPDLQSHIRCLFRRSLNLSNVEKVAHKLREGYSVSSADQGLLPS